MIKGVFQKQEEEKERNLGALRALFHALSNLDSAFILTRHHTALSHIGNALIAARHAEAALQSAIE